VLVVRGERDHDVRLVPAVEGLRDAPGHLTSVRGWWDNAKAAPAVLWTDHGCVGSGHERRCQRLRSAAMAEIWNAIAVALVSGGVLLAVQLGGWRGLKRRAVREDLELLKLLDDEHVLVRERLRARVATKLEQYEPGPDVKHWRWTRWVLAGEFALLAVVAVVIINVFDVTSLRGNVFLGTVLGIAGNVLHWLVTSRRDKAEQDKAVATVRLAGQVAPLTANFRVEADTPDA
jgi:hypothetical protein